MTTPRGGRWRIADACRPLLAIVFAVLMLASASPEHATGAQADFGGQNPPSFSAIGRLERTGPVNATLPQPLKVQVTVGAQGSFKGRIVWTTTSGTLNPSEPDIVDFPELPPTAVNLPRSQDYTRTLTLGPAAGVVSVKAALQILASANNYQPSGAPDVVFTVTGLAPRLDVAAGDKQTGLTGTTLAQPLVVTLSGDGLAGAGRMVTWRVTSGAATLAMTTSPTDSSGQARNTLTLDATPGPVLVTASVLGAAVSAQFTATAKSPSVSVVSGDKQTGLTGTTLRQPLVVSLSGDGSAGAGRVVTWQIVSGTATLAMATSTTDENGRAQNTLTLGSTAGDVRVTASVRGGSVSAEFTATAKNPDLTVFSGDGQTGLTGATLPKPLVVGLTGAQAAGPGRVITWQVVTGAATLAMATSTTDENGRAQNTLTLGSTGGDVRVTASVRGGSVSAEFTATAKNPDLTVFSGDGQTGLTGATLPKPLVVGLTGAQAAGPGRVITWQVVTGAATLAMATSTTDASGHAQNTLTFGTTAGEVVVKASVRDGSVPAQFRAIAKSPMLTIVSGDKQTGFAGTTLANPLVVALTGAQAAGPGRVVTWQVTSGTATLATATSTADANGRAQNTLTLGATPGGVVITASVHGTSVALSADLIPSIPTISVVSGNNQIGVAGITLGQPLVVEVGLAGVGGANQVVTWKVTTGSATLGSPSTPTGSNGQAQTTVTLGDSPGTVVVTAAVNGTSVPFTATATSPTLSIVSGNNQAAVANTPLPQPLVVAVAANGQPAVGRIVSWQVISGAGTFGAASSTTDGAGRAQTTLTLGATTAPVEVSASVSGTSVHFAVNNATQAAVDGLKSFAVMGNVAVLTTTTQTKNLGLRLASLRKGATGINISDLALNVDGQSFPLGALASLAPGVGSGTSASTPDLFSKLGVFATGQGTFGDQDPTSREPGFSFHTAGLTAGVDYRFTDQFILGMAGGYMSAKSTLDNAGGDFTAQGGSLSLFGTYYLGQPFYVDLITTYGWSGYDTHRRISVDTVAATANGETDGRQFALSTSVGYDFNLRPWTLGAYGRLDYINVTIDGFKEQGAGLFDLNVSRQSIDSVTTALGGRLSYVIGLPWAVLIPQVNAEWQHEFLNDSRLIRGTLLADPTQAPLAVPTNNPSRNYVNLGAGLSATFARGVSAFVYWETVLGYQNFNASSFTGGIRIDF